MNKTRKNYDPQFRLDAAQLVVDQGYSVRQACESMGVSKSSMDNWVRQLNQERRGETPKASALTADQRKIQELEKRIRQIEMDNPREMSSRSDKQSARSERVRLGGEIPPWIANTPLIEPACFPRARPISLRDCPLRHLSHSSRFCGAESPREFVIAISVCPTC